MGSSDQCPFCPTIETINHLFLQYPRAVSLWQAIGFTHTSAASIEDLWTELQELTAVRAKIRSSFVTSILFGMEMQEHKDFSA
uniref:Reverse transcriptase zinc-binding domain-containing protein n=1 Tax=Arundo donax TaxID=35708 RepID=A0A0A8XYS0_ARUDO